MALKKISFLCHMLLFATLCLGMEFENQPDHLTSLPDELVLTIFSCIIPVCQNPTEALQTIKNSQLTCKRWFRLINDKHLTKKFVLNTRKFIIARVNCYPILYATQKSRKIFNQFLQNIKTITQHALVKTPDFKQKYGYLTIDHKNAVNPLGESFNLLCRVIQEEDLSEVSKKTAQDFGALKQLKKPKIAYNPYPREYNPYKATAHLIYLEQHTEQIIETIFKNPANAIEIAVLLQALVMPFNKQFTQHFFWHTIHIIIKKKFKDDPELKKKFIAQSLSMFNFALS